VQPAWEAFKFLFLGGAIKRKGFDLLMQAYTEEFSAQDDVSLVVKDYGGGGGVYRLESEGSAFVRAAHQNATGPEVEYLTANMDQDELRGLYTAADLLVIPFRGEGFGMPISEMMASGGAVMVPNYGAALDFATPEAAYLVPAQEVTLPQADAGDGKQSVPLVANAFVGMVDMPALRRMMRHAVEHPEEVKAKGRKAREAMQGWSWDHAAAVVEERLEVPSR
jgi:glycosyltransferase involved in cell wall biosynthesis